MLRVRSLLAHAKVRRYATSVPKLLTAAEMMSWDAARVVEFAKSELELGAKTVSVLEELEVNDKSLLTLTEDELLGVGMPLGPASDLATAVAELRREYLAGTSWVL